MATNQYTKMKLTPEKAQVIVNALHCLAQRDGLNAPDACKEIAQELAASFTAEDKPSPEAPVVELSVPESTI